MANKMKSRLARVVYFSVVTLLLGACATGPIKQSGPGEKLTSERPLEKIDIARLNQKFQLRLNQLQEEKGFPGATAAYALPSGYVAGFATGMADKEVGLVMQPHMLMLSASIGKSYVAAVLSQLADEGLLSFDDPLSKWLGERPWFDRLPNARQITIAHLLSHSAGVPDWVYAQSFYDYIEKVKDSRSMDDALPPEKLISFILDAEPPFPVGQGYSYSDTGFLLLGLVIEEVTQRDYYDVVTSRLLEPLELTDTLPANRRDIPNLSQGYGAANNKFGMSEFVIEDGLMTHHPGTEWTGGGLVSTAPDLVRWFSALFGTDVAGSDYASRVKDNAATNSANTKYPAEGYGLGIEMIDTKWGCAFAHSGWTLHYLSYVIYYVNPGVSVSVMVNTDNPEYIAPHTGDIGRLRKELDEVLYDTMTNGLTSGVNSNPTPPVSCQQL